NESPDWKLDYWHVDRLTADEMARRRVAFDEARRRRKPSARGSRLPSARARSSLVRQGDERRNDLTLALNRTEPAGVVWVGEGGGGGHVSPCAGPRPTGGGVGFFLPGPRGGGGAKKPPPPPSAH